MKSIKNQTGLEEKEEHTDLKTKIVNNYFEWIETFIFALAAVLLMFTFVMRYVVVDGTSMTDTLKDRDALIISNLGYKPKTGDIIVISAPHYKTDEPLVKRVIATEGQTVDIDFKTWKVTVDGVVLDEDYVKFVPGMSMEDYGNAGMYPITVDKNCVFVMGDNRNGSIDSRSSRIGQLNEKYILGKVIFRVWPVSSGIGVVN